MVLFSKPGGTDSEKKFVETINSICNKCKSHLVENRDAIERWNLDEGDLKALTHFIGNVRIKVKS